jgi:hypothetical protein
MACSSILKAFSANKVISCSIISLKFRALKITYSRTAINVCL